MNLFSRTYAHLSPNVISWHRAFRFLVFAVFLIDVVWSILLYDSYESFAPIIEYMYGVFLSMPVMILVVSFLHSRGLLQYSLVGSFLLSLAMVGGILFGYDVVVNQLFWFGVLFGSVNIFLYFSNSLFFTAFVSREESVHYSGLNQVMYALYYLVIPVMVFVIERLFGDVRYIFLFALVSLVFGGYYLLRMGKLRKRDGELREQKSGDAQVERKTLVSLGFILGIKSGIFWAFFSIMIFSVLGGYGGWVVVTLLIRVVAILSSRYLERYWRPEIMDETLVSMGIVYAAVILVFVVNASLVVFVLFGLLDAAYSVFLSMYWGYA